VMEVSTVDETIPVRFLLFPNGQEIVLKVNANDSFLKLKEYFLSNWPSNFDPLDDSIKTVEQIRFIHSGKAVENQKIIRDVFKIGNTEPGTVHIFLRKQPISQQTTPITNSQQSLPSNPTVGNSNPSSSQSLNDDEGFHMHSSLFGEDDESIYLKQIFDKKQGEDGKIEFVELFIFLKTYWKFLADQHFIDPTREFPAKRMMELKKRYVGEAERITRKQFVTIYFLIDSKASKNQCPQGTKDIVKTAAVELHRNLNPAAHWSHERFEDLFTYCDKNHDGSLTCRELDLFFYLYQIEVTNAM